MAEEAVSRRLMSPVYFGRTLVEIQSQSEKLANYLGRILGKDYRGYIHSRDIADIIRALGYTRSQNSEFHKSLIEIIMDNTYERFTREAAVLALGYMGAGGTEVQKTLIAAIEPGFPFVVRRSAIWSLSKIGLWDENTEKALIRVISDENFEYEGYELKAAALRSMARMKTQSPEAQNAIVQLLLLQRNDNDKMTVMTNKNKLRGMAAATLGAIGFVNEPAQVALAQVLTENKWTVPLVGTEISGHALCKIGLVLSVGEETKTIIKQHSRYNDIFTRIFKWKL